MTDPLYDARTFGPAVGVFRRGSFLEPHETDIIDTFEGAPSGGILSSATLVVRAGGTGRVELRGSNQTPGSRGESWTYSILAAVEFHADLTPTIKKASATAPVPRYLWCKNFGFVDLGEVKVSTSVVLGWQM